MSDYDADLARALALSLEESNSRPKPALIDLDSDGDEGTRYQEDLQNAIKLSQQPSQSQPSSSNTQPSGAKSFLSERAQLEKERRERQKRLRGPSPSPEDSESGSEEPPAKRNHVSNSASASFSKSKAVAPSTRSIPTIDQMFWTGELRQTATQHAEPRKDGQPTFRLTEVLGKKTELEFAIMSSYSLDFPWIYEFFDKSVPVIMVAQPDATGAATIKNVLPNWIRTTPFLPNGYGCQHMKFMLLFYKTGRLRVVISTANLITYDWRDMENSVWLQDIPLRSKPLSAADPKTTSTDDFPAVLQRLLNAVNVKPALAAMIYDNHPNLPIQSIEDLRLKWDWSNVKVHLVASFAGKHEGWPRVIQTGHPRLMTVVRKMGMRTGTDAKSKKLVLECQGSSIGTYTTQWMNEFHWSARGESAESWLPKTKKSRAEAPYPPVRIVFPSKATVQASTLGEQGGGTVFCRRKQWAAKNFPRASFYDSKSKGGPVLMHSKMIIAMLEDGGKQPAQAQDESDDDIEVIEPAVGWAYVGSHNFTPSAWGTLSGSAFSPVLNISNYEVGVVFLLKDAKEADRVACFQRPLRKYTSQDDPWVRIYESSFIYTRGIRFSPELVQILPQFKYARHLFVQVPVMALSY
ncbi:hypothetical protein D9619_011921 [Psilocybe cf. subviscida]|uniref:PLD phosphodiesterase domain-containing protein n=1 Tax=Psilocybe cf. subviscida TaxID=2480587 RepID=A0A8H5EVY0_9AGAR|nr:hypothetical protein D9619_011921 [Psilocybe cf. subviscida]